MNLVSMNDTAAILKDEENIIHIYICSNRLETEVYVYVNLYLKQICIVLYWECKVIYQSKCGPLKSFLGSDRQKQLQSNEVLQY